MSKKNKKPVILLVEDEKMLSDLLMRRLEREGYTVQLAQDGIEAMQKLKNETPDVVLLDLCLPRQSGFETLEKLAKEKDVRRAPIIVISNLTSEETMTRAKQLGVSEYFVKSRVSHDKIIERLHELLKNSPSPE